MLVAVGRDGNRNESSRRHLLHEGTLDAASRVLDVERDERLELALYLLFLCFLPYWFFGKLLPLWFLYRQGLVFLLCLLLFLLHLPFSLQEVELPLVLLRLNNRVYLHLFHLFRYKLLFSYFFQVPHLFA